jgi:indolepyruvate ferredoxin oxidoreductase beta subunit
MAEIARRAGSMINAVMLGAIAGSGRLPITTQAFEAAIRADGKAVESNLRGFRAGLDAARACAGAVDATSPPDPERNEPSGLVDLERRISTWPAPARDIAVQGLKRLAAYQDAAYAQLYLDRLEPIVAADARLRADGRLAAETARQLALRMSYEDVVKVAETKIDPARFARIAGELGAQQHDIFTVTEFLKPGIEELCSILPPALARRILAFAARRGLLDRWHVGMAIKSNSVSGFLRIRLLASLKRFRRNSFRFAQEQQDIDTWLGLIQQATVHSAELALEIVECARLIKGYGDTHRRGSGNYRRIATELIMPALAGRHARAADAIASARTAALLDPEGEALARCLADIDARLASPIAAE